MIIRIDNKSPKPYGNFFLAFEAPGDEEEVQPIETMDVSDEDTDFTNVGLDDDDDSVVIDDPDMDVEDEDTDFSTIGFDEEDPEEDTGDTIYQAEEEPPMEEPTEDPENTEGEVPEQNQEEEPTEEEPPMENEVSEDPVETPQDEGEVPTDNPEGEEGPSEDGADEEPAEDDDDDFTNVGTDEDSGVTDDDAAAAAGDGEEKKGPGIEYDSTRKYNLYLEYMSLYNAINNYISKLENNVKDDMYANRVIKDSADKLREIRDLCYDYMMIKFEISSYTQSLVFYQTLVVAIQAVFKLLAHIHDVDKKNSEKTNTKQ